MNRILIGMTLILAIWLSACAAQSAPTPPPAPTPAPVVTRATVVAPTAAPTATLRVATATVPPQSNSTPVLVQIGDNDKGKTFAATVGAHIRIVLHSTYWQFDDISSPALKQLGSPVVTPDLSASIPGTGAGTVAVEFQAVAAGEVSVQATRTSCGEALLCAQDQRVFQVTITIK